MILPGEHVIIFGMSGSGKSTLTRKISGIFSRMVIFDRLQEWPRGEVSATDFYSFQKIYREKYLLPEFNIVFQPRPGMHGDELLAVTNQILHLIYSVEKSFHENNGYSQGIALIFEEVWLYAPIHQTPPFMQEIALTGRHYRISLIGNAQRPASVTKTIVSQARHFFIGQYYESRDAKYYYDTFGDIPELDKSPEKFNFYWFRPGQALQLISVNP